MNTAIQKAQASIANKVYIPKKSRNLVEIKVIKGKLTLVKKQKR